MSTSHINVSELTRLLGSWVRVDKPLSGALADALVELIDSALLPPGSRLPAQREVAKALGTARGTVVAAYETLETLGFLSARRGSGTWVRARSAHPKSHASGRLFSFTSAAAQIVDLSSGALPASSVVSKSVLALTQADLEPYLHTDGYFPAGLPVLRRQIAATFSREGVETLPDHILVTTGAQQATWLTASSYSGPGDIVLVEEPGYRGSLEAFAAAGAIVQGIRMDAGGIDVEHVRRAAIRGASLLYCQTGIHNPTGRSMDPTARRQLADVINHHGLLTVEDTCSRDLVFTGDSPSPILSGLVNPDLLITIGSASKLFWGGLRVGWIIASKPNIFRLVQRKRTLDLATSSLDQILTSHSLESIEDARVERRVSLTRSLAETETVVRDVFPDWSWERPVGGAGIWVETGMDSVNLAETGKRIGVLLAAGTTFSSYDGLRTHLRLPIWHESDLLGDGLVALKGALDQRVSRDVSRHGF